MKAPEETPIEFLNGLRSACPAAYTEAALVTQSFCDSFYGAKALSRDKQAATDEALARLKSILKQAGNQANKARADEHSHHSERS